MEEKDAHSDPGLIFIFADDIAATACTQVHGCPAPPLIESFPAGTLPSSTERLAAWIDGIVLGQCNYPRNHVVPRLDSCKGVRARAVVTVS